MEIEKTANSLTNDERTVISKLEKVCSLSDLSKDMNNTKVQRILMWLLSKGIVRTNNIVKEVVSLGNNGKKYKKEGLPEKAFLKSIEKTPKKISQVPLDKQEINACIGLLKKNLAINIKKDKELIFSITKRGKELLKKKTPEELFLNKEFPIETKELKNLDLKIYNDFSKRKEFIETILLKDKKVSLTQFGKKVSEHVKKNPGLKEKLTPELLISGKWKNEKFRRFDVSSSLPKKSFGRKHFVNDVIKYVKKIWLELGFEEMKGNNIQSAFWDMDALFVPQNHPAREMQDTFYIKGSEKINNKIFNKIKEVHETGGNTGSVGWKYKFSKKEAEKLLLRTHTTVLSALTIANLKKKDLPKKFFAVGKVFRNENLDAHHLFEFHQVEGIVIDPNANLQHLKGYLREFYTKMGFTDVRMRPGHFPYTEPSLEVDVFHPVKKKWIELGGAGIFRPEVVKPLLGFDCPVLAWGQGLERIAVDYWKLKDLRDLYNNDLKHIKELKKFVKCQQ